MKTPIKERAVHSPADRQIKVTVEIPVKTRPTAVVQTAACLHPAETSMTAAYTTATLFRQEGDLQAPGDGSVPRVIVTGFDTDPGTVKAGSNFKLVIHLKNTSKKTAVKNMLFDLQAPASGTDEAAEAPAFLPVSGSSSIYLEGIPADGTKDISIDLNSRADLIQKPYSITMTMKYEDGNATQFEGESSLAIPVTQEARFEFSEIKIMPDTVAVYEEANITCSLYNLGRVKMYNVKAKFEGDAIEGEEQFIGNLESGATGTVDSIVTAVAESYEESNCKLVFNL